MTGNSFRAFGLLVLALVFIPLLFAATAVPTLTLAEFVLKYSVPIGAVVIVGLGLCFLRKWAALYFSVPLFWFGIKEAFVSIYEVPFPGNLLVMIHGLSLTLPLAVTVCLWKHLTWGRRFF